MSTVPTPALVDSKIPEAPTRRGVVGKGRNRGTEPQDEFSRRPRRRSCSGLVRTYQCRLQGEHRVVSLHWAIRRILQGFQPEIPTMGDGTPMEVARALLASTNAGRISSPILAGAWDRITHVGKKREPPANKPIAVRRSRLEYGNCRVGRLLAVWEFPMSWVEMARSIGFDFRCWTTLA
jgi:hypothetical protein